MKKTTLIDVGTGVVLANTIAAILRPREDTNPSGCVLVLTGGQHLHTPIAFDDVLASVERAIESPPITDMVPELASAFQLLKNYIPGTPPDDDENPTVDTSLKDH